MSENPMETIARLAFRDPEVDLASLQAENAILRAKLQAIGNVLNEYAGHPVVRTITTKMASIR